MIGWPCQTRLTVEREGWCGWTLSSSAARVWMSARTRSWRVCGRRPSGRGRQAVLRVFATFTSSLEKLRGLAHCQRRVVEVVMEATGPYWKPIWYVLEDRAFELKLVNAKHVKMVPGRKTDMAGLRGWPGLLGTACAVRSCLRPRSLELRDLTRCHQAADRTHGRQQRVQKTLEDAGIKLDSVASDIFGVSGRQMLAALIAGERDPDTLAELAKGTLRNKIPQLREALRGRFREHHATILKITMDHVAHLEDAIASLDVEVDRVMVPFSAARDHLEVFLTLPQRRPGR